MQWDRSAILHAGWVWSLFKLIPKPPWGLGTSPLGNGLHGNETNAVDSTMDNRAYDSTLGYWVLSSKSQNSFKKKALSLNFYLFELISILNEQILR